MNKLYISLSLCLVGLLACNNAESEGDLIDQDTAANTFYSNPVFEPVLADPTVVRDLNTGLFYAFGTADDWGDGTGTRMVPVLKSADLTQWEYVKNALPSKPNWKQEGGIWAPDVNQVNGKYYMYYAYSTWGDPDPGIGLAIADAPGEDFIDQGKVFLSSEVDVPNSIDPCFFEEDSKKYLFWGSFSDLQTQGTYVVELTDDGKEARDLNKKIKIAAGDWEAVMIHKKDNYYYFFGSKGSCCEGVNSKYHVLVGRSEHLLGPYIDQEGRNITERGTGTLLVQGNEKFVGTGHNAQIISDDAGDDWLLYHGIDIKQGNLSSGISRRVLLLDKLEWEDGWPLIEDKQASTEKQQAPVFK